MNIDDQFGPMQVPGRPPNAVERLAELTGVRPGRSRSVAPAGVQLVEALFREPQRWGWEYVEPKKQVSDYPYLDQYPQWQEPPALDLRPLQERLVRKAGAKQLQLAWLAVAIFVVGCIILANGSVGGVFLLIVSLSLSIGVSAIGKNTSNEIQTLQQQHEAQKQAQLEEYRRECARWDAEIQRHHEEEERRFQATPLLYPLVLGGQPSRVDVFGGTSEGWAALLATMGSSALAGGNAVTVLDLSGQNVAGALAELTTQARMPVSAANAPVDLERIGLLGDLAPEDVAEILAEAMGSMRGKTDQVDLHAMDAELIHTVARHLEQPRTFSRLAAGVQVLRSTYDPDATGPLSSTEITKLNGQVDLIDKSERVREELGFVGNLLERLVRELELLTRERFDQGDADSDDVVQLWPEEGLSVIRTTGQKTLTKKFVDLVLFHTVAHHITNSPMRVQDPILVVAGADELGRSSLEAMTRSARSAGVRLVYLFERLREDSADLLGGGDSVALIMKIGNGKEAATAAEYIGKGFTFQLSQLTRQLGRTVTVGGNTGVTKQVGGAEADVEGSTRGITKSTFGSPLSRSLSDTWSRSLTRTWSESRTKGHSESEAKSATDGQTYQRSYEFTVEPTQIQHLEPTAFVLVHSAPEGRRVTMGDCFPGIAVIDRVSLTPR